MVEAGINFMFDTIHNVFAVWLIQIKIFNISLLYYLVALVILGIMINGVLNTTKAGEFFNLNNKR